MLTGMNSIYEHTNGNKSLHFYYFSKGLENNLSPRDAIAVKAFKTITNSNGKC